MKTTGSKSREKRVLAAVFVVERDGSDHVEDPQGNVIDEMTLSQKHQNAFQGKDVQVKARVVRMDSEEYREISLQ